MTWSKLRERGLGKARTADPRVFVSAFEVLVAMG
jgi:hypothetical protein